MQRIGGPDLSPSDPTTPPPRSTTTCSTFVLAITPLHGGGGITRCWQCIWVRESRAGDCHSATLTLSL